MCNFQSLTKGPLNEASFEASLTTHWPNQEQLVLTSPQFLIDTQLTMTNRYYRSYDLHNVDIEEMEAALHSDTTNGEFDVKSYFSGTVFKIKKTNFLFQIFFGTHVFGTHHFRTHHFRTLNFQASSP